MEVSGKVTAPSKQSPTVYCFPCGRDDLKELAHGYCQDCQEHLCKSCFQHHRRSRPSRDHVLLDKDTMPLQPTTDDLNPDVITKACTNHRDKPLEFYCNNHKRVVCYVCVTLEHKQCKVDYIPDVSGNVSEELKDLIPKMEELVKKCEFNIQKVQNATTQLDQSYEKVVEEIRLFRKEINAHLDRMESAMLKDARSLVTTAKNKFDNVNDACVGIAEEVKRAQSLLNALSEENKKNQLFIEMKKITPCLTSLTDKEKQAVENTKTEDNIEFVPNKSILEQLKLEKSFGMISTYRKPSADSAVDVQYDRTINPKISSDKEKCDVNGMVMISTTHLIIADFENKNIKMIEVGNGELVSEETLSSAPQDVIKLPNNKLAVTLWDEKCIQIMSYTDTSLSLDRRIHVGEWCYCVAYCQGKIVVGCDYNPGKLLILDLQGNIIQVFDAPGLFDGPKKIIISSDERSLYISDYLNLNDDMSSKVIKMDWEGNIVQRFQQQGYKAPQGIQELEDGTLLVCYYNSHNIVRLSSSLKRCEIVGLEEANLYSPGALVYSESDHKLYVSCSSEQGSYAPDTIKIFDVKWV